MCDSRSMGFSRSVGSVLVAAGVIALAGCGGDDDDQTAEVCADFTVPPRPDTSACAKLDPDAPDKLSTCEVGSGHAGRWVVDADGLPAYDLLIDQRCDPAGQHWSPRAQVPDDPIHLLGNGRGLVAMAHASGGIEVYTQDRGHKWLNRIDEWRDPANGDFPVQLGGGFGYVVDGDQVHSTRFEDLPVGEALERQTRRFGVGYVETVTTFDELVVTRRVFAPDHFARALIVEVTVENLSDRRRQLGLVELWDANLYQAVVEYATSDLLRPDLTEGIERRRRELNDDFTHLAGYDPAARAATLATAVDVPPIGPDQVDEVDWHPETMYLAPIDQGEAPDAVWLYDGELWDGGERPVPQAVATEGTAEARSGDFSGEGQHGLLAMRVPVQVPVGASITRRFAFGYLPGDADLAGTLAALRARFGELRADTVGSWRDRMVWAAFPELEDAGALQRELAWSSYLALAGVTYDELRGLRVLGQGGAYKYIHGLDGAAGDLALLAEGLTLIDPQLASETLRYALTMQDRVEYRFAYATTGVGAVSDVGIYDQRSDAYFLLPAAIARYAATARDLALLDQQVEYGPPGSGTETVLEHLLRIRVYAQDQLGLGARGLPAMGTGDYADGVLSLADEEATPGGSSSAFNAGFVVQGFRLAADVVESRDAALAAGYRADFDAQAAALTNEGWNGRWFERGFVDSGNPLAPDLLFLEPQLFPILAGLVSPERRDELLELIAERLETDIGAMSTIEATGSGAGGLDEPQIGGVWPVANAWLTEAYALRDPELAWSSLVRNTLFAHARAYPELWYGIWTGPDSYNGPGHERPGEADAHLATALTDYPAFNMHAHLGPLRALAGVLGIRGTRQGLRIDPRVPTAVYTVKWPRLTLASRDDSISGSVTPMTDGSIVMEVTIPAPMSQYGVSVTVGSNNVTTDFTRTGDVIRFVLTGRRNQAATWRIRAI
jgi:nicotinamide mononucleotide (NMN) deamidase PncC